MSRVAVVFTGGTISSQFDAAAGGNVPMLDGAAILARTPGLSEIADVVPIDRGFTAASHFTFPYLFGLADTVRSALEAPDVDGCVVAQGTDSIEESSFFLDLVLTGPKPVVFTGAMRAASEAGYDGPANLRDAVRVAASEQMHDQGVVVVLARSIDAADDVTKTHATALETFRSLNLGPIGRVEGERVVVLRRRTVRRHVDTERAAERIHLITAHAGIDGTLVDAAMTAGADGFVVEAHGAGNTDPRLLEACVRALDRGIPVVLTTRSAAGQVGPYYGFPGGGAQWIRAGALPAGYLGGPKARVALALGIGAGLDRDGLAALLADPQ
ncbi:MAG TPA: asparaginase [Candidatus Limnocylindrales bacterium]|jgi:L-asparaginase|nr:asparaginase [Candidatus Limnocylindrales bacterium]